MAICDIATAQPKMWSGDALGQRALARALVMCALVTFALTSAPAAAADKVRLTGLSDLAFGPIADLTTDAVLSENVCIYSSSATSGYHVTASGPAGGAFTLTSPSGTLAFDVAWSSASGQSSGALLTPNVPLTGQITTAKQQTCNSGPATTASLIVILRAAALSSAKAGNYTGILTLVVGAE